MHSARQVGLVVGDEVVLLDFFSNFTPSPLLLQWGLHPPGCSSQGVGLGSDLGLTMRGWCESSTQTATSTSTDTRVESHAQRDPLPCPLPLPKRTGKREGNPNPCSPYWFTVLSVGYKGPRTQYRYASDSAVKQRPHTQQQCHPPNQASLISTMTRWRCAGRLLPCLTRTVRPPALPPSRPPYARI